MKNLFILTENFNGFPKGTIIQKGSEVTEEGIEFFDVTTEMQTGECYSVYNIPDNILVPANEGICFEVTEYFDLLTMLNAE